MAITISTTASPKIKSGESPLVYSEMKGPTGFALAGTLLAMLELECMDKLDEIRDEAGDIHLAFAAADVREPYRSDYEKFGIKIPD